jgi:hypothetical protein
MTRFLMCCLRLFRSPQKPPAVGLSRILLYILGTNPPGGVTLARVVKLHRILEVDLGHRSARTAQTGFTRSAGTDRGTTNSGRNQAGAISGHHALVGPAVPRIGESCEGSS